ncbi:MAG: PKD domain-containing protein [Acidimicrobiales bacterium]
MALCLLLTTTTLITSPASAQEVNAAAEANPNILIIGDSNTSGLGVDPVHSESLPTYRSNLQASLNAAGGTFNFVGPRTGTVDFTTYPGSGDDPPAFNDGKQDYPDSAIPTPGAFSDFEHAGQPGYRVADALNGFWGAQGTASSWTTAGSADIVLIYLGTVDVFLFENLSDSADDMRAMIDAIRLARPNADIVLANIATLTPDGTDYGPAIAQWNTFINSIATEKDTPDSRVVVADINTGYDAAWNYDGITPAALGQAHIAAAFMTAMSAAGMVDNAEPVAQFTNTCGGLSCTADGSTTTDDDGTIVSYAWDYGDGGSDTGATPAAHAYSGGGTFTVTLTVTDNDGAQDSSTSDITVSATNLAPTAAFTSDCTAGLSCTFDASTSSDPDGTIADYAWEYGDGTSTSGTTSVPTHPYATFATYSVKLTVTDDDGATDSVTTSVTNNPTCRNGYWLVEQDADVYPFGNAQNHAAVAGSGANAVDIQATPDGCSYWVARTDGTVTAVGGATALGNFDLSALEAGETLNTISATATGNGLWGFTTRGRVLLLGDAVDHGDMLGTPLNGGIIDSATTPSGNGYYMLGSDGGIFTFGDAVYVNSLPGMGINSLNKPAVGLVPDPDGVGYWIVAGDGGVFGVDAPYRGSIPALQQDKIIGALARDIIGMVPYGNGYLMVAGDGGVFNFSNLAFEGSLGDVVLNSDIVSITPLP